MPQTREILSQEQRQDYITAAAREAGYEEGFGVRDCDLKQSGWWAVYTRQSLEEQAQNNRLPDYLRTCAHEARDLGVVVP